MEIHHERILGEDAHHDINCEDDSILEHNGSSNSSPTPSLSPQDVMIGDEHQQQHAVKQWSYEEQFRQLYNLSPEPDRKEFLDKLFDYMAKKGTPITRIPIMAKQPLDMYKLFKLVVERGGLVEVIKKKAWRDIAKELNLPASITSAAFTMRSQYVKYLYPYECEVECLSDPKELQMAIESNKRDRRHSDNVDFLQTCRESERRDQLLSQPTYAVTGTPSGLQLISSPTVAIPQASMPPYSGGFIITPGGTAAHVVHPSRLSPGGPQLLQMAAATHPHLPIVVPTTLQGTGSLATMIPVKAEQSSSLLNNEKKADDHDDESPLRGHHHPQLPIVVHTALQAPNVMHMKNEIVNNPTVISERRIETSSRDRDQEEEHPPPSKRVAVDTDSSTSIGNSTTTALRMPFTNISIRPSQGGVNLENSSSVLVTLELNGTVYQGVLFACPRNTSTSSPPR